MTVGELPLFVRLVFYATLLSALAVAELLTDQFYGSLLVLVGFLFVVLPVTARVFGRGRAPMPHASGRAVVAFAAGLTLLTAIEVALIPDFGLSALFWIVVILIPSLEFLAYFARREARIRADSEPSS